MVIIVCILVLIAFISLPLSWTFSIESTKSDFDGFHLTTHIKYHYYIQTQMFWLQ